MNFARLGRYTAIVLMMQFPFASFSQQQNKRPSKPGRQAQIQSPGFDTVQVLDHARRLSDDARGLTATDEIRLQTNLADSVWPLDQTLGERLLTRSFELTLTLLKEPAGSDPALPVADPQTTFAFISSIASKNEPKFEKKLKERWEEAVASLADKGNKVKPDPAQMASLLLRQSANSLRSDEQKARQLFRQSVSIRVTQDHYFFLMHGRTREPRITDILFSDILDVLAERPLIDANEILVLSSYLFSPDGAVSYVAISGYNTANVAANLSAVPKNPALAKRYLALLFTKLNPNQQIPAAIAYFMLKNLVPHYQVLAPELLDHVYAKMANLLPNVSKDDFEMFDDAYKGFNASDAEEAADWEKRIQNADKIANEDRRDLEYFTIVFGYLVPKKDFVRAALFVSRVNNQELREKLGDLMSLRVLESKLERAETASSVSEADCNKIKTPLVRVMALSNLGQARLKQKATGEAVRLFTQATGEADKIKNDQDRLQAKLMLVQLSLDVDSSVGFEWATAVVKEINQFSDFNMNRSQLTVPFSVYGLKNELEMEAPAPSSLASTVAKMCR